MAWYATIWLAVSLAVAVACNTTQSPHPLWFLFVPLFINYKWGCSCGGKKSDSERDDKNPYWHN